VLDAYQASTNQQRDPLSVRRVRSAHILPRKRLRHLELVKIALPERLHLIRGRALLSLARIAAKAFIRRHQHLQIAFRVHRIPTRLEVVVVRLSASAMQALRVLTEARARRVSLESTRPSQEPTRVQTVVHPDIHK
jgi:hypothetical protein